MINILIRVIITLPNFSDIDECTHNGDPCHAKATCIDSDGSYHCVCNDGYTGEGHTCAGNIW